MANMYVNAMTDLWNTSGTVYSAIKMNVTNAASAAGSKLLDLQVGGVPKYTVDKNGNIFAAGTIATIGIVTSGASTPITDDGAALGASGTGWSDLFLAAGGVVNFAAGDATITHATDLLAFGGAANGYSFDARIKPAVNDGSQLGAIGTAWADLFLASGAVIDFNSADVQIVHADNSLTFMGSATGYTFDNMLKPLTNDGAALGASGIAWSDLFLALGAVINFAAGDVTLTHSADVLTITGGDLRMAASGTNATSVVTVGGTQTLTNKTLDAPTITGSITGALAVSGNISTPGTVSAVTSMTSPIFTGSGATVVLSTTGAGTVILRPNGAGSTTGQLTVASGGAVETTGSIGMTAANAMLAVKSSTGNAHVYLMNQAGTMRAIMYTASQSAGHLVFQNAPGHVFYMLTDGGIQAPGRVYSGAGVSYLETNGNVIGSVWDNLGYGDAYTALVNRIESRCAAYRAACVTSWRMAGYIEYNHTSGTYGVSSTYGGYVMVMSRRISGDNYLFGYRQPQLYTVNSDWFAAFNF